MSPKSKSTSLSPPPPQILYNPAQSQVYLPLIVALTSNRSVSDAPKSAKTPQNTDANDITAR